MILYCDYCGTVFGLDAEVQPTHAFCCKDCEADFHYGPTQPPVRDLASMAEAYDNEARADDIEFAHECDE